MIAPPEADSSCATRIANLKVYVQPFWDWGNAFTKKKIYPAKIGYCGYALSRLGILYDGRVNLCCGDYDGATCLGTVAERSLTDILASAQVRRVAAGFQRNRLVDPYCQRCMGSPSRIMAFLKGLATIYLFKVRGHPLDSAKNKNPLQVEDN